MAFISTVLQYNKPNKSKNHIVEGIMKSWGGGGAMTHPAHPPEPALGCDLDITCFF